MWAIWLIVWVILVPMLYTFVFALAWNFFPVQHCARKTKAEHRTTGKILICTGAFGKGNAYGDNDLWKCPKCKDVWETLWPWMAIFWFIGFPVYVCINLFQRITEESPKEEKDEAPESKD